MEIPTFAFGHFNIDVNDTVQGGEATIFIGSHPSHGKVAVKKWNKNYYDTSKETVLKREVQILMELFMIHLINMMRAKLITGLLKSVVAFLTCIRTTLSIGISNQASSFGLICLKFESILLGESYDDVKLSDFGIARSVDNMTHSLTTSIGTDFYMAPEILKREPYTFSADIYSLSITIWEILHRRIPYDHVTRRFDLLTQVSNGVRPELENDLSEEVSDFLKRCWHANAIRRPEINEVLEFCSSKGLTSFKRTEIEGKKQAILLLGGMNKNNWNSVLMLENNRKNWKKLNIKLPYAIFYHGAQFLNNTLYIFGGVVEGNSSNSTYKLSKSLKWEKMADMKQKRHIISNSSVILNNQIWVCGGANGNEWLKSVEMYDPETNEWKEMRSMNQKRVLGAAAVVNGKIFCAGGYQLDSVECYDPSSDVWTLYCNMPKDAWANCAVEMNGNFVIMGGRGYTNWFNNVWALDTTDKDAVWIEKPSMSIPRGWFSVAKIDEKTFICGGCFKEDKKLKDLDLVEIFDGEVWSNGPKMPTYQSHSPAVVIPMQFARKLKQFTAAPIHVKSIKERPLRCFVQ